MHFDAFAGQERAALFAFAWSLTGNRAVAEDLVQDALEQAWRNWDRVGDYEKPGAWARRVIANRATDGWRRRGREQQALGRLSGVVGHPDPDPWLELDQRGPLACARAADHGGGLGDQQAVTSRS
jgi:DNA-directed RNA polymerase specialized sigma24 family protein